MSARSCSSPFSCLIRHYLGWCGPWSVPARPLPGSSLVFAGALLPGWFSSGSSPTELVLPGVSLHGLLLPGILLSGWVFLPGGLIPGSPCDGDLAGVWGCVAPSFIPSWSASRICWVGPPFMWVGGFCGSNARFCLSFVPTVAAPLLARPAILCPSVGTA